MAGPETQSRFDPLDPHALPRSSTGLPLGGGISMGAAGLIATGAVLGDRYRVVRILGQGGFGRTYLAEDLQRCGEACVLKEFAPQVYSEDNLAKAQRLFEREAGVLYRLSHDQIPRFRELRQLSHNDQPYLLLVQDFVPGRTYREALEERQQHDKTLTEAEVALLLCQILPVLSYLHGRGVIHRDIAPDNLIQRASDGLPVLIDFGAVKQAAVTLLNQITPSRQGNTRLGKLGYAPPEQMQQGTVFPHSDVYALGATALTLLSGAEPQNLMDPQSLDWTWQELIQVSPRFAAVLNRMVALRPRDRYPSAKAALVDLERLGPLSNRPVPSLQPSRSRATGIGVTLPPTALGADQAALGGAGSSFAPPPPAPSPSQGLFRPLAVASPADRPADQLEDWPAGQGQNPAPFRGDRWRNPWAVATQVFGRPAPWPATGSVVADDRSRLGPTQVAQPPEGVARLRNLSAVLPAVILLLGFSITGLGLRALQQRQAALEPAPVSASAPSSVNNAALPPPPPTLSVAEVQRQAELEARRVELGLPASFFEAFMAERWQQLHPELGGRALTPEPADAGLRQERDQLTAAWLEQLSHLAPEQRSRLGTYSDGEFQTWVRLAGDRFVSPSAFANRVDLKLAELLPELLGQGDGLMAQQLRWAIASLVLQGLRADSTVKTLTIDAAGNAYHRSSLQPGQEDLQLIQLRQGQTLRISLKGPNGLGLRLYRPSNSLQPLVPGLVEQYWEGRVPESGTYEIRLRSEASSTAEYMLNLIVE